MAERVSRRDLGRIAATAALGLGVLLSLTAAQRRGPAPVGACERVVLLDGVLSCAPPRLRDACGGSWSVRGGDAFESLSCEAPMRMSPHELAALGVAIDVNEADADELASLQGIGPALAARIVEGRPYERTLDLLRVHGIGPATLAKITPRVRM